MCSRPRTLACTYILRIISTVLNWDIKDLESRASKLERERAKLGKEQLQILKAYTTKSQDEQDRIRKESQTQSISIVTAILKDSKCSSTELTEQHHKQALEYLSIHLSIRDRKQLIQCLCRSNPDHLTTSVREVVDAYEPVIRRMHKAIDLSSTVSDLEYFLGDMIKLARVHTDKSGKSMVPTVGDFVQLLRKHQRSSHVFIHQVCKNDKELTGWYLDWAKHSASQFKREPQPGFDSNHPQFAQKGAGTLTPALHELFSALPEDSRSRMIPILDLHSAFLDKMHEQSTARLQHILRSQPSKNPAIAKIFSGSATRPSSRASSPGPDAPMERTHSLSALEQSETSKSIKENPAPEVSATPGPGSFLARWQALLDATPITPLTQSGSVKAASSPEVVQASATDVDGSRLVHFGAAEAKGQQIRVEGHTKDDSIGIGSEARERQAKLKVVIDAMGDDFRKLLAQKGCYW